MGFDLEDLFEGKSSKNRHHRHQDAASHHEHEQRYDDRGFPPPRHSPHKNAGALLSALLQSPQRGVIILVGLGVLLLALVLLLLALWAFWPLLSAILARIFGGGLVRSAG